MSPRTRRRIARWHGLAGLLIALFAALHLLNHAAAFSGPQAFSSFRALLRRLYQQPVYEAVCLFLPILFNTVTGFWMVLASRATPAAAVAPLPPLRQAHRLSGLGLACLLLPHMAATRGLALGWDLQVDFHFIAGTLRGFGGPLFAAWYLLLVVCATTHLSLGIFHMFDAEGSFPGRRERGLAACLLGIVGALLLGCGLLGLLSYAGWIYPPPTLEPLPLPLRSTATP
jgi:succinate dehydrogenase/fumarate reductase cytochrome b subunit